MSNKYDYQLLYEIKHFPDQFETAEIEKVLSEYGPNERNYTHVLVIETFFIHFHAFSESFKEQFLGSLKVGDTNTLISRFSSFLTIPQIEKLIVQALNSNLKTPAFTITTFKQIFREYSDQLDDKILVNLINYYIDNYIYYKSEINDIAEIVFKNHALFCGQKILFVWESVENKEKSAAEFSRKLGHYFNQLELGTREQMLQALLPYENAMNNCSRILRNHFLKLSEGIRGQIIDRIIETQLCKSSLIGILKDYHTHLNKAQKKSILSNLKKDAKFNKAIENLQLLK